MNRLIILIIIAFYLFPFYNKTNATEVIKEKIILINEDGKNFIVYETNRTDYYSYNIWYNKTKGDDIDEYFRDYLYFYPNVYNWDSSQEDNNILELSQGSYAILQKTDLSAYIKTDAEGVYTYKSWDGKTYGSNGHFGSWNSPDDFSQYMYVWVFPEKYEIVAYECNREGDWVKRQNTIAYYGKNVNDICFTIKYRTKAASTFQSLNKALKGKSNVSLEQSADGVKITLGATVLFASGSAELSEKGKSIMADVTKALKQRGDIHIIIEGHTDNVPIKGELAKTFLTNWELSSARSLTVLHYLADNGLPESNLEARAFGSQRPVATQNTEEGRAKNRRIELLVSETNK